MIGTAGVEDTSALFEKDIEVFSFPESSTCGSINLVGILNVVILCRYSLDVEFKVEVTSVAEIVGILVDVTESYRTVLTALAVAGEKAGGLAEYVRMLRDKGKYAALNNSLFSGVQAGGVYRLAVNAYNVTNKYLAYPVCMSDTVSINREINKNCIAGFIGDDKLSVFRILNGRYGTLYVVIVREGDNDHMLCGEERDSAISSGENSLGAAIVVAGDIKVCVNVVCYGSILGVGVTARAGVGVNACCSTGCGRCYGVFVTCGLTYVGPAVGAVAGLSTGCGIPGEVVLASELNATLQTVSAVTTGEVPVVVTGCGIFVVLFCSAESTYSIVFAAGGTGSIDLDLYVPDVSIIVADLNLFNSGTALVLFLEI